MNIWPALVQQRIIIYTAIIIVAITAMGSWYATRPSLTAVEVPTQTENSTLVDKSAQSVSLSLRKHSTAAGTTTYELFSPRTEQALSGIEVRLRISGVTEIGTNQKSFTASNELQTSGLQQAVNMTSSSETGESIVELSFFTLNPEGWAPNAAMSLGTLTLKPVAGQEPQFTIDPTASKAYSKDGTEYGLNITVEPAVQK